MIRDFEIVDLFLSLGSPEVLYEIRPVVCYIFATLEDIIVLPESTDIGTQCDGLKSSQESIAYTEIIEVDFLHLCDFFRLIGHIWTQTEYNKTLFEEIDISLYCLLADSEELSQCMV